MATVHWTQPNFKALAEDDGHGDTCAPIIMLDYMHVKSGVTLDYPTLNALRTRLINDKLMGAGTGMTMGSIVTAMKQYYGVETIKYVPWNDANGSAAVLAELHADIKQMGNTHCAFALETHNAAALPGNQPGIQNHFILEWGIDSDLGYLTANGDLLSVLAAGKSNPAQGPVWVAWEWLAKAEISSYAIWPAMPVAAPTPPPPPVTPAPPAQKLVTITLTADQIAAVKAA